MAKKCRLTCNHSSFKKEACYVALSLCGHSVSVAGQVDVTFCENNIIAAQYNDRCEISLCATYSSEWMNRNEKLKVVGALTLWCVFPIKIQFISRFYVQPSFFRFKTPLFNHDIRFSTSTFILFNLDSRFLSSAFILFKHNVCYSSLTFVLVKRDDFVICF